MRITFGSLLRASSIASHSLKIQAPGLLRYGSPSQGKVDFLAMLPSSASIAVVTTAKTAFSRPATTPKFKSGLLCNDVRMHRHTDSTERRPRVDGRQSSIPGRLPAGGWHAARGRKGEVMRGGQCYCSGDSSRTWIRRTDLEIECCIIIGIFSPLHVPPTYPASSSDHQPKLW